MIEIWKPIKNYEELYEVSNLGNVRNLKTFKALCKIKRGVPLSKKFNVSKYYIYRIVSNERRSVK